MISLFQKKFPAATEARIDGQRIEIAVRVSARARSYRLSIPHRGAPVLTVPRYGRWSEAQAFLDRQTGWLAARLKRAPARVAFAAGARVPVRGVDHLILATGKIRGRVEAGEVDALPAKPYPAAAGLPPIGTFDANAEYAAFAQYEQVILIQDEDRATAARRACARPPAAPTGGHGVGCKPPRSARRPSG